MNTWVFGYGSLVSPTSLGYTLGRSPVRGVDFLAAECDGWERRWNYGHPMGGSTYSGADVDQIDTVIALGVAPVSDACMNGVIALVDGDELERLDRRERNYDRVDVTDGVRLLENGPWSGDVNRVVTYVPRPNALDIYADARERGRAGIEIRYWNLVNDAFDALLPGQGERYRSTTPAPDVPVLDVSRVDPPRVS
ncbi:MAG: gamma-glutamylcyclotransferase [Actinomycetota bacterium]|nr:gamma-glutamylcyclotransferase [Actinomycetota bacterium]